MVPSWNEDEPDTSGTTGLKLSLFLIGFVQFIAAWVVLGYTVNTVHRIDRVRNMTHSVLHANIVEPDARIAEILQLHGLMTILWIVVAACILLVLLSIAACFGAAYENLMLLGILAVVGVLLVILQFVQIVLVSVNGKKEFKHYAESVANRSESGNIGARNFEHRYCELLTKIQTDFKCCGIDMAYWGVGIGYCGIYLEVDVLRKHLSQGCIAAKRRTIYEKHSCVDAIWNTLVDEVVNSFYMASGFTLFIQVLHVAFVFSLTATISPWQPPQISN